MTSNRNCPDCGTGIIGKRKIYCAPCGDRRRDERAAGYRKARRDERDKAEDHDHED